MQQRGLNYTCVQKYELSDDTVHAELHRLKKKHAFQEPRGLNIFSAGS